MRNQVSTLSFTVSARLLPQERAKYFKCQPRLFPGHILGFLSGEDLTFNSFFAFLRLRSLTSEKNCCLFLWHMGWWFQSATAPTGHILLSSTGGNRLPVVSYPHGRLAAPASAPSQITPSGRAGLWKSSTPGSLLSRCRLFRIKKEASRVCGGPLHTGLLLQLECVLCERRGLLFILNVTRCQNRAWPNGEAPWVFAEGQDKRTGD